MVVFWQSCKKRSVVYINGVVKNINGTTVKIMSIGRNGTVYDSTVIKDQQFSFNTTVQKDGFYSIAFECNQPLGQSKGWRHACLIYLEDNKEYTFTAVNANSILYNHYQILSSSQTQQDISRFQNLQSKKRKCLENRKSFFLQQADVYLDEGDDTSYRTSLDSVRAVDSKIRNITKNTIREFIVQCPNSILTPYLVCQMDDFFENYLLYRNIINRLPEKIKETEYAKRAEAQLKSTARLHIGCEIPDIYGSDIHGKPFNYNFAIRKYVLIDFWASWCNPCRMQAPSLRRLYNNYRQKGFDIISISLDERRDWWKQASKLDSISWYNVCEAVSPKDSKNVENFVANHLPYNYLVNGHGRIIMREVGLDSLERFLKISL